jgi:transposase-like protein
MRRHGPGAHAGKGQRQMVLALINTVFAQETQEAAVFQWRAVADQLRTRFPKLAALMDDADSDLLAFMSFGTPENENRSDCPSCPAVRPHQRT